MRSFKLELPKTKKGRILAIIVIVWCGFALAFLVQSLFYPRPNAGFIRDVKEIIDDINDYHLKFGCYPSSKKDVPHSHNWPQTFEYQSEGNFFVISGWDGENYWTYSSETGKFSLKK